jgi:sortase (surface protein transpeptidase)
MKKSILAPAMVTALLATAACSPGHVAANRNGVATYVYVGCHEVTSTPSDEGSYAFQPLGDLRVGDRFFFKQVGHSTVAPVTTGKPCS